MTKYLDKELEVDIVGLRRSALRLLVPSSRFQIYPLHRHPLINKNYRSTKFAISRRAELGCFLTISNLSSLTRV